MPKLGGRVSSSSYNPYPSKYKKSSHKRTSTLLDIVDSKFGPTQSTPIDTKEPVKACAGSSKKKAGVPPVEKRGAIFKKACPKTILERVDRVVSQRFFLIERTRSGKDLREVFRVLGSTGNVYTVKIDRTPTCDCPDASKGNHCKHILFVYLKVLQVPSHSGHWYQKALLTSELQEIFDSAPPAPNAFANPQIRDAYARATGSGSKPSTPSSSSKRRVPGEGDDCPVCYDGMAADAQSSTKLTYCESCGNAIHTECFKRWEKSAQGKVTCVWCRAVWVSASTSGASGQAGTSREGYLNLSGVTGVSPVRDTSSYYHGPRRGQHYYGYQDYADD